jgi:hypothetical protein
MAKKLLFLVLVIGTKIFCQNHQFKTAMVDWDHPPAQYKKTTIPSVFKDDHLVIINDNAEFKLAGSTYKT